MTGAAVPNSCASEPSPTIAVPAAASVAVMTCGTAKVSAAALALSSIDGHFAPCATRARS